MIARLWGAGVSIDVTRLIRGRDLPYRLTVRAAYNRLGEIHREAEARTDRQNAG